MTFSIPTTRMIFHFLILSLIFASYRYRKLINFAVLFYSSFVLYQYFFVFGALQLFAVDALSFGETILIGLVLVLASLVFLYSLYNIRTTWLYKNTSEDESSSPEANDGK